MKKKNSLLCIALSIILALSLSFPMNIFAADPVATTVEGIGNYFITGESYPTQIVFSGYNSRDDFMYINTLFSTNKTVAAGNTATFSYYVEVFDGDGIKIGGVGTSAAPETVAGVIATTTAQVTNKELTLTAPLTAEYRVVITVTGVAISL